jgi:mono/diheme cytochrome c family protein
MLRSGIQNSWSAIALILVATVAVSCSGKKAESPTGEAGNGAAATGSMTPLQRGEILAYTSGCHDCHTPGTFYGAPDFERQLSGSELGWQGPWGVTYARNLTPDPETGLGTWTDDEIIRALRSGVRKDGSPILPPMPWQNFARMPAEDMSALIAYLRSVPAVKHAPPERVAPGGKPTGPVFSLPPPPAWDAPKAPAS